MDVMNDITFVLWFTTVIYIIFGDKTQKRTKLILNGDQTFKPESA